METTWSELAASIKTAYARYYLAVRNEQLTREILDLLVRLERVALVRYESGLAPQQDVIRAQVEITTMRGDLLMLESERAGLEATLNSLLARKVVGAAGRAGAAAPDPAAGASWNRMRWPTACAAATRNSSPATRASAPRRRIASSPTRTGIPTSPSASRRSRWARASASGN